MTLLHLHSRWVVGMWDAYTNKSVKSAFSLKTEVDKSQHSHFPREQKESQTKAALVKRQTRVSVHLSCQRDGVITLFSETDSFRTWNPCLCRARNKFCVILLKVTVITFKEEIKESEKGRKPLKVVALTFDFPVNVHSSQSSDMTSIQL